MDIQNTQMVISKWMNCYKIILVGHYMGKLKLFYTIDWFTICIISRIICFLET